MLFMNHVHYAFSGAVAHKYGIQAAMVLNRIIWAINFHEEKKKEYRIKYFVDDRWWMDDTYESLANHFNGLIGHSTIKRYILQFEKDGLLISRKRKQTFWDQTKWYSLNGDEWNALHGKPQENSIGSQRAYQSGPSEPIEELPASPSSSSNSQTNNQTNTVFFPSDLIPLAEEWHDFALREMKWTKPPKSWSVESFAEEIERVMKAENLNIEGMKGVLQYIEHGWWAKVITTPKGLMKLDEEGQRRITKILRQMKPKSLRSQEKHEAMSEEEKQRIDDETTQLFGFGGKR